MPKMYLHTVKVRGNLSFPIDMLRYDRCSPKTEIDSRTILNSFDPMEGTVDVEVVRIESHAWFPTEKRWESFGWKVISHEVKPA